MLIYYLTWLTLLLILIYSLPNYFAFDLALDLSIKTTLLEIR